MLHSPSIRAREIYVRDLTALPLNEIVKVHFVIEAPSYPVTRHRSDAMSEVGIGVFTPVAGRTIKK